ncbi:MAG: Hsp20/alpha crystallin family protein, partial [Candidatus Omnitrophica bacterium]|nr:Hsp20/alpha crystallin family protein [Candidatus Omnitrophota bacterium]
TPLGFTGFPGSFGTELVSGQNSLSFPRVNIRDEEEKYRVQVIAPGLESESVQVTAQKNRLEFSGHIQSEKIAEEDKLHRTERSVGRFQRSFRLPTDVKVDEITAEYRDGVLNIEVPKADEARPRSIEVAISN